MQDADWDKEEYDPRPARLSGSPKSRRRTPGSRTIRGAVGAGTSRRQTGRPATATAPGFTAPPYDPNLVKRTFDSPPNQLVLASYPNGRPGALRPISLAPPDQEDDFEDVATVTFEGGGNKRVSLENVLARDVRIRIDLCSESFAIVQSVEVVGVPA